ncbi:MAG TPA: DUF4157 domain-containing protein [Candidatus Angelobacter sp.]
MKSTNQVAPAPSTSPATSGLLQRKCACGKNASGGEQCEDCKKKTLQRHAVSHSGSAIAPPIVHEVLRSPGQPLGKTTRDFMEPKFGHDFSHVRVHTDERAAESARAVDARAYTVGNHIAFDSRNYSPGSRDGQKLIAHELAHTIQQKDAGNWNASALEVAPSTTPAESSADAVAEAVATGQSIAMAGERSAGTSIQRQPNPQSPKPQSKGCDDVHQQSINKGAQTAQTWISSVVQWFDTYQAELERRKKVEIAVGYRSIGESLFAKLSLLNDNFGFKQLVTGGDYHATFPDSAKSDVSNKDLTAFWSAAIPIRSKFVGVKTNLQYNCQPTCPGTEGAERAGQAVAGSEEYTICTGTFDKQSDDAKTAVVLHEAFHATFNSFDHDTYSSAAGYPGADALTNADSYATFASIVATGSSYRIQKVEETVIKASAEDSPSTGSSQGSEMLGSPQVQRQIKSDAGTPKPMMPAAAPMVRVGEHAVKSKPSKVVRQDAEEGFIRVTPDQEFRVEAQASVAAANCPGLQFGFVQLCRPFSLYRAVYKSLKGRQDIEIDPSTKIRARQPVLDVANTGDTFTKKIPPLCSIEGAEKPLLAGYSDRPSSPFKLFWDSDHYLQGIALQHFFFVTLTAVPAGQPPQHLKSLYWEMKYCEGFDPDPRGPQFLGASRLRTTEANVGDFIDGAPAEGGIDKMGKPADKICKNVVNEEIAAATANPSKGTFNFGC